MNRREFIKAGSAGAFFIAAGGKAFGIDAPSNRVRLGVVGCSRTAFDPVSGRNVMNPKGNRGRGYQVMMDAIKNPGVEIGAVCDVDREAMDYAASEVKRAAGNEPKKYLDIRDLLADPDIDGVIVATPDHWHVLAGCWTMQAKKALYLEKPVGVTPGEAEILAACAHRTGAVFQLGTQRRSSLGGQYAAAALRSGEYGKPLWAKAWCLSGRPRFDAPKPCGVPKGLDWDRWQGPAPRIGAFRPELVHYNWRFFRGYGTGDLPNNGLHFVDVARWLLGAEWPTEVYAGGGKLFHRGELFEYEDTQMLNVKFPDGKFLTWEGCSHTAALPFLGETCGCVVYCEGAVVHHDRFGGIKIYDTAGKKLIREWTVTGVDPAAKKLGVNDSAGGGTTTIAHAGKFAECVRNRDPKTASTIDDAVKSDLLTSAGNVSLLANEAVKIDPQTGRLADPNCAAAKFWNRTYEPGWEPKA